MEANIDSRPEWVHLALEDAGEHNMSMDRIFGLAVHLAMAQSLIGED